MKSTTIKDLARTLGTLGLVSAACVYFAACKRKTAIPGNYAGIMSFEASGTIKHPEIKKAEQAFDFAAKTYQVEPAVELIGAALTSAPEKVGYSSIPLGSDCIVTLSYGRGKENGQATAKVVTCTEQQGECGTMEDWEPGEKCLQLQTNVSTQLVRLPGGDCGFSLDRHQQVMKDIAFAADRQSKGLGLVESNDIIGSIPSGNSLYATDTEAAETTLTVNVGDVEISFKAFQAAYISKGNGGLGLTGPSATTLDSNGLTEVYIFAPKDGGNDALAIVSQEGEDDDPTGGDGGYQNAGGGGDEALGLKDRFGNKYEGKVPKTKFGLVAGDVSGGPGGTFKLACKPR